MPLIDYTYDNQARPSAIMTQVRGKKRFVIGLPLALGVVTGCLVLMFPPDMFKSSGGGSLVKPYLNSTIMRLPNHAPQPAGVAQQGGGVAAPIDGVPPPPPPASPAPQQQQKQSLIPPPAWQPNCAKDVPDPATAADLNNTAVVTMAAGDVAGRLVVALLQVRFELLFQWQGRLILIWWLLPILRRDHAISPSIRYRCLQA